MLYRRLIVVVAGLLAITACGSSGPATLEVITDGPGAGFGNFSTGGDKTFGVFICSDGDPIKLESIEANGLEGDVELKGGLVYTTPDRFVGAVDGFPPEGIEEDRIEPIEGAVVEIGCVEPNVPFRVQLLVGLERTGNGGGKIDGFVVHSDVDDVEVEYQILMCGDNLEFCEGLVPSTEA